MSSVMSASSRHSTRAISFGSSGLELILIHPDFMDQLTVDDADDGITKLIEVVKVLFREMYGLSSRYSTNGIARLFHELPCYGFFQ